MLRQNWTFCVGRLYSCLVTREKITINFVERFIRLLLVSSYLSPIYKILHLIPGVEWIFCTTVYNEQLYSLIVWSKVALFFPWTKNRSQLKLLVIFFPLGQKTIAYSTFYGTYLFRINLFFYSRCSL
jgi:hypothetical protein